MNTCTRRGEICLALAGGGLSFQGFSHPAELRHQFEQGRSDVRFLRRAGELQAFFGALPILVGRADWTVHRGKLRHSVLPPIDKVHECGLFPESTTKRQEPRPEASRNRDDGAVKELRPSRHAG